MNHLMFIKLSGIKQNDIICNVSEITRITGRLDGSTIHFRNITSCDVIQDTSTIFEMLRTLKEGMNL
jgi:hypothetical protein